MLASFSNWLALAPLWEIFLVLVAGMIVGAMVGGALRSHHARGASRSETASDPGDDEQGVMVAAVMGLLALLIAFTFAIALDRFDARRVNVINEANAIGTTYLRSQMLEEPHRARLSQLLVEYTDARIALATTARGPKQTALLATSDRLIADLWTATVAAFPSIRPYSFSHSFLDTMNNLIDMDSTRKAGRQAHVPSEVFLILFFYQFVVAGLIRYAVVGEMGGRAALVLFFLFGVLTLVIIDVDRPTTGGITESQEPMLQLRAFLRAQPPKTFDRFNAPSEQPE